MRDLPVGEILIPTLPFPKTSMATSNNSKQNLHLLAMHPPYASVRLLVQSLMN